jgi:hypothetical protein
MEFFDEEECPACQAERWSREYDEAIKKEVARYNKRTGESREANDFYFLAPEINRRALRGLKMLKGYVHDHYLPEPTNEPMEQRELFSDLPF